MLLEQDILDLVLGVLQEQRARNDDVVPSAASPSAPSHRAVVLAREMIASHGWSLVTNKSLLLLRLLLIRNQENQLYAANRLSMLLTFVNDEKSAHPAINAINELLGNPVVLEEKVKSAEIEVFINMMRSTPLNGVAMKVLAQLCECDGEAVESNQQLLVDHLLLGDQGFVNASIGHLPHGGRRDSERGRVLQQAKIEASMKFSAEAADSNAGKKSQVSLLGFGRGAVQLVGAAGKKAAKGVGGAAAAIRPRLSMCSKPAAVDAEDVSFTDVVVVDPAPPEPGNKNQLRPAVLVAITPSKLSRMQLLFPLNGDDGGRNGAFDLNLCSALQRDFLTSQLLVLAAMCSNRFYVAITLLKRVFPYEHLSAQITTASEHMSLRSAFVRLITTLYVDCEPQVAPVGSHLTFRWSQVQQPEDVQLSPPNDEANAIMFRSLQRVISRELKALPMNSFTTHVLDLLSKLLDFSFYNTDTEVLQSVVDALIAAVTEQLHGTDLNGEVSTKRWAFLAKTVEAVDFGALQKKVGQASKNAIKEVKDVAVTVGVGVTAGITKPHKIIPELGRKLSNVGAALAAGAVFASQGSDLKGRRGADADNNRSGCKGWVKTAKSKSASQRRWVAKELDSIPAMIFILTLVFAAVAVTLGGLEGPAVEMFEFITFGIFATELSIRIVAVGNLFTLLSDPFTIIDFVVVMLDLIVMVSPDLLSWMGGGTKGLRSIRMLRLVRSFRMIKLAIRIRDELRKPKPVAPWTLSDKFVHSPKAKLQSLTAILGVLLHIDDIIGQHRFATLLAGLKLVHAEVLVEKETDLVLSFKSGLLAMVERTLVATRRKEIAKAKVAAAQLVDSASTFPGLPGRPTGTFNGSPGRPKPSGIVLRHLTTKLHPDNVVRTAEQRNLLHSEHTRAEDTHASAALCALKDAAATRASKRTVLQMRTRAAEMQKLGCATGVISAQTSARNNGHGSKVVPSGDKAVPSGDENAQPKRRKSYLGVGASFGMRPGAKKRQGLATVAATQVSLSDRITKASQAAATAARRQVHITIPTADFQACLFRDTILQLGADTSSLTSLLFNMIMFDWAPLAQNAIELMMKHFESASSMIQRMSKFQMLLTDEDETLQIRLAGEIKELYQLVEQYEVWSQMKTTEHFSSAARCAAILDGMADVLAQPDVAWVSGAADGPGELGGGGSRFRRVAKAQALIRNLGGLEIFLLIRNTVLCVAAGLNGVDGDNADNAGSVDSVDDIGESNSSDSDDDDHYFEEKPDVLELGTTTNIKQFATPLPRRTRKGPFESKPRRASIWTGISVEQCARRIRRCNNRFLCHFIRGSPENQKLAFRHVQLLISDVTLGRAVGSVTVLTELFLDNEELVHLAPSHLVTVITAQMQTERDPQLLSCLSAIVRCSGDVIRANQIWVFQALMAPELRSTLFLVAGDSTHTQGNVPRARRTKRSQAGNEEEFAQRKQLMQAFARRRRKHHRAHKAGKALGGDGGVCNTRSHRVETDWGDCQGMPSKLIWHAALLRLLCICSTGKINIVEATLQKLYPVELLLSGIEDAGTSIEMRLRLMRLLFTVHVSVQVKVNQLTKLTTFWDLLETFPAQISRVENLLKNLSNSDAPVHAVALDGGALERFKVRSNLCLVLNEIMPFTTGFLDVHYDRLQIATEGVFTCEHAQLWLEQMAKVTMRLCTLVNKLNAPEYNGGTRFMVGPKQTDALHTCMQTIAAAAGQPKPVFFDRSTRRTAVAEKDLDEEIRRQELGGSSALGAHFMKVLAVSVEHPACREIMRNGVKKCSREIKKVSRLADPVTDEIRFEPLISKMVTHAQGLIEVGTDRKTLPRRYQESTMWMLRLFREMVEDEWGFSIDDRDELGDDDSDELAWEHQKPLTECGVAELCVDLIANGIERSVILEATRVLVALLYREGGSAFVQAAIVTHLQTSVEFFRKVGELLRSVCQNSEVIAGSVESAHAVATTNILHHADINFHHRSASTNAFVKTNSTAGKAKGSLHEGDHQMWSRSGPVEPSNPRALGPIDEGTNMEQHEQLEHHHHHGHNHHDHEDDSDHGTSGTHAESVGQQAMQDMQALFLMLQLLMEGHYLPSQELLREQPLNDVTVNILELLVDIVARYSRLRTRAATRIVHRTCEVILESIQGPCTKNQVFFTLETELMESLNSMLIRFDIQNDLDQQEEEEVKVVALRILRALTECQQKPSLVYERLLSAVHVESLTRYLKVPPPPVPIERIKDDLERALAVEQQMKREQAPLTQLQVECLVLVQMLCDYDPAVANEVSLSKSVARKLGTEVVSVEIVWKDTIQRRFFHVPGVCKQLEKVTRDDLVESVNRTNQDKKHQDFMRRSKIILCGLEHQAVLSDLGVASVFCRVVQWRLTNFTFVVNLVINMICLQFLGTPDEDRITRADGTTAYQYLGPEWSGVEVKNAMTVLTSLQITASTLTLFLYLVLHAPVVYKKEMLASTASVREAIYSQVRACVMSIGTGLTPYYMVYLAFAILGRNNSIWNSFLLFDILVKNSTSRDVLMALINPIRQLAATFVLMLFTIYVFSFLFFLHYRGDFSFGECDSLGSCFATSMTYGLRSGGGIGDYLYDFRYKATVDQAIAVSDSFSRFWLDLAFFMLVVIILLNIIFGIIIDNFAELRDNKKERTRDIKEFCFICRIPRAKFDKMEHHAYDTHIKKDHCMWNYLKFMVYIWNQDRDNDDGLEQYVRQQMESSDVAWFPDGTCMSIDGGSQPVGLGVDGGAGRMGGTGGAGTGLSPQVEELAARMDQRHDQAEHRLKRCADDVAHVRELLEAMARGGGVGGQQQQQQQQPEGGTGLPSVKRGTFGSGSSCGSPMSSGGVPGDASPMPLRSVSADEEATFLLEGGVQFVEL
jgi:hypothetical protein